MIVVTTWRETLEAGTSAVYIVKCVLSRGNETTLGKVLASSRRRRRMQVMTRILSIVLTDAVNLVMILVRLVVPVIALLRMIARMKSLVAADAVVIVRIRSAATALAVPILVVGLRTRKKMKLVWRTRGVRLVTVESWTSARTLRPSLVLAKERRCFVLAWVTTRVMASTVYVTTLIAFKRFRRKMM
jgi:hypothetical protein